MHWRVSLKLLWRDWKGGELTLLAAALVVAVTTVATISIFVDRLQQALVAESSAFLAADRVVRGSRPVPDEWLQQARAQELQTARTLTFSSMVFAGDRNQLVSVKAVTDGYPLRGTLEVADEAFVEGTSTDELPAPGNVWIDGRLLPSLDVSLGDTVAVGDSELRVDRVITSEPDRGGSLFDMGPRLLMRMADVEATGVVQPGSRLSHALLLAGPEDQLQAFRAQLGDALEPHFDWIDIRTGSNAIGRALERGERFLLLGGLLAVILAGVAVALAANRYSQRHQDPVAVLKTLGMTPGGIQQVYLVNLLVLGVVSTVLGLALGWVLQRAALWLLADWVPVALPPASLQPYAVAATTGLVCLLAFALPPLLRLRGISPMRVIQRDFEVADSAMLGGYLAGLAGILVLLFWYAGSPALAGWLLLGGGVSVGLLLLLANALLRGGRMLGMQAGSSWRIALAALQRRQRQNSVQVVVFGIAIMLLLILFLLRTALLDQWQGQIASDAPNHFLLNIAPHEVAPLRERLQADADGVEPFYPMSRGRVVAVNGEPTGAGGGDNRQRIASERNLTWSEQPPPGNRIVAGRWWTDPEAREVSVGADFADDVGIELGDRLRFRILDRTIEAEVTSLRAVDWDSLRPNFFMILTPGVMSDLPATWLTSFRLESDRKEVLNALLRDYPTVTVIEIDAILAQVQQIVARVTLAVEVVLALVIAAGGLVLVASLQSSLDERMREFGLLRALGARRRRILGALILEFLLLGLLAGLMAAAGAEISVWFLQTRIFELDGQLHPLIWVIGPLLGMALIGSIGTFGARSVVTTAPAIVLRAAD